MNLNRLAEKKQEISKSDLMAALKNLNEAWSYLYAAEQRKIVKMLVNSVKIQEKGVTLNMNLDGFDNLFVELAA